MTIDPGLQRLISALPELYQPIYGHPDLSARPSRPTDDRLALVRDAARALSQALQRPLRILDLGSAQGYVTLALACDGHEVVGIEAAPANIEVARYLAAENPHLKAHFEQASIEAYLPSLSNGAFDLVVGLSVFHHLNLSLGAPAVTALLDSLAPKIAALICELALASEPVYWSAAQPADEQSILRGFAFCHEFARVPTHLSDVTRPLLFASNSFWYLGSDCRRFHDARHEPHALGNPGNQGTRTYAFADGYMAKRFRLSHDRGPVNRREIEREVQALAKLSDSGRVPAVLDHGCTEHEAWLVRESAPGTLLLDFIAEHRDYDPVAVIADVLDQLALFEEHGLFHDDLAPWNVLVAPDGRATLIDFGALSDKPGSVVWPTDPIHALLQFVHIVSHRRMPAVWPIRYPLLHPSAQQPKYQQWANELWTTPSGAWTYKTIAESFRCLVGATAQAAPAAPTTPQHLWPANIESQINDLGTAVQRLHELIGTFALQRAELDGKLELERAKAFTDLRAELAALRALVETERHARIDMEARLRAVPSEKPDSSN